MKSLFPILFIIAAGALFFMVLDPAYDRIKILRVEEAKFNDALTRSRELQQVRDQLLSRYNTFARGDIERLEKFLPDHIDNVRLILDLDSIAARYGMRLRGVALESSETRAQRGQVGPSENGYESLALSFSVTGSYNEFRAFLADLEQSLRLVDLIRVEFTSNGSGIYDYSVSLKTYWLKP
jgi:Tfp pilus assembly protein PilO